MVATIRKIRNTCEQEVEEACNNENESLRA
jgi:hypothetical protein